MSEKVFMFPEGNDNNALTSALMNGGINNNNWIWILFLFMLYGRNGINGGTDALGTGYLSNQMNNDSGRELLMQAINNNGSAISTLASNLNCDINSVKTAINNVQSAVCQVGNQVGMSVADVKNSITTGNMGLIQQLASCCCNIRESITNQGYQNQIQTLNQTNVLQSRIDQLANGVQQGFSQIGYNQQTLANNIIQAGTANTQRIIDTLNNHWTSDLQQKYADAKFELSQQSQNAYLIAQLKTTA